MIILGWSIIEALLLRQKLYSFKLGGCNYSDNYLAGFSKIL